MDEIYALMMDELDGELTPAEKYRLTTLLQQHPELAREWQAMQAVDKLFSHAPMVVPAPRMAFASRTIARLPNLRARRWAMAAVYAFLLTSGVLPVILGALVVVGTVTISAVSFAEVWQIMTVLGQALRQILLAMGNQLGQQPAILGIILVMLGSISLWTGVYRQLVSEQLIVLHVE
ncbi:MAG: hypothetical protein IPL28_04120 [Chloroflexi bacterium]|nr:hypothetical protein [Chloroflexota bacterium]